jgi:hypothetical protein
LTDGDRSQREILKEILKMCQSGLFTPSASIAAHSLVGKIGWVLFCQKLTDVVITHMAFPVLVSYGQGA